MTAPSVEQPLSRRATIADVAERAGVSRSAVSKVLRNAYGISDAMRASVEQAMAALDYRPQIAARGLRGRTYTLGVVMPDMRNPFFPDILDGIWSALQNTAYQPLLAVRHSEHKTEQAMIEMMLDRKLDGFVMIAPIIGHDYLWRLAATVPIVMIGRHETGGAFDSVNNDDERGAYLAVEHLIQQGHKRIAFFSFEAPEDSAVNPVVYRQRGYIAAMQAHGLDRYLQICKTQSGISEQEDRQLAHTVLTAATRPTAIFAWHDAVAINVLAEADALGLQVPQALAVVGYDNFRVSALPQIQLSSVDQDAHAMGSAAAELLIERIEGRTEPVHFMSQPTLFARRSSLADSHK
nr:LacI family DNA-binding transcriptional regulator [uncultured Albidiferax sp.]